MVYLQIITRVSTKVVPLVTNVWIIPITIKFVNMMALVCKHAMQNMLMFWNNALIKIVYIILVFSCFIWHIHICVSILSLIGEQLTI